MEAQTAPRLAQPHGEPAPYLRRPLNDPSSGQKHHYSYGFAITVIQSIFISFSRRTSVDLELYQFLASNAGFMWNTRPRKILWISKNVGFKNDVSIYVV